MTVDKPTLEAAPSVVIEANQRLSQSQLWTLQRQFFEQEGIQAWNTGKVPHYVTSNPFIANAYGQIALAFLRDWLAAQPTTSSLDSSRPIYILELGAGSGRFAYHFLKQFFAQPLHPLLQTLSVKYVMTDFAAHNLEFWQAHPALQPYIEEGVLDFAQFDIQTQAPIQLFHSGNHLTAETLANPLIVLANYFFDSIPQDLFALQSGQLQETLLTLTAPEAEADRPPAELLKHLQISYRDRPITGDYYDDSALNQVLEHYQQHLDETSLMIPIVAIRGLIYLRQLAGDRLLFLTADKGYSRDEDLAHRPHPKLTFHQGCFSLSVNYHAIGLYTQFQGGQALLPTQRPKSLNVCAFLFGSLAYAETHQAYDQWGQQTGPDNFFALKKTIEPLYPTLTLPQILAYLRFAGWDHNIFFGCLPAFLAQVETTPDALRPAVMEAIQQLWAMYYWIGEEKDLPLQLSRLLAGMGDAEAALEYVAHSLRLYGDTVESLEHQAVCYLKLGETEEALTALDRVLALDSDAEASQALKQAIAMGNETALLDADIEVPPATRGSSVPQGDPLAHCIQLLQQTLALHIQGQPPLPLVQLLQSAPASLARLGQCFQLSAFEAALLLLCLGLELEPNLQALCAQAQGGKQSYATLGLALSLFPDGDWAVLSPQSPLHHWRLIHTESGRLLTDSPLKLDRRILCYLLGRPSLPERLADYVTPPLSGQEGADALPPSHEAIVQQLIATWSAAPQRLPLVCLLGADVITNTQVAVAACDRLELPLLSMSAAVLPTDPQELAQLRRAWEREALLTRSCLLLDCESGNPGNPGRDAAIALFLETLNTPVMMCSRDRKPQVRRPLVTFDVPPLTYTEQKDLWLAHLGPLAADLNSHVDRLAAQFQLSPTGVQTVCMQAKGIVENSTFEIQQSTLSLTQNIWNLCRAQARPNLDDLAQRIEAVATWEDLVLPDRQRLVLEDIGTQLRYQARVYQDWGFAKKGNRGLGTSALFYGESGTGKTMAAEVLAHSCQLDLYRIDLSTVVSKYIGETEKNLRRIFDAAETGGVILLFDEADALFGKRSEVKDSHDRHANIEVSYLLQRMEAYRGLAILTSNMKEALDTAFLRRIRFMLSFPFPDAEARAKIWQRIFPAQTPTQGLDYARLGQLKVAGGNIRNVALQAAFLAAQADQPVGMGHIRQAAQREYLKLERLLTNEEIKGWDDDLT